MDGDKADRVATTRPVDQYDGSAYSGTMATASGPSPFNLRDISDDLSDDAEDMLAPDMTFTGEDAESLIEPSISRAATRMKSPNTPAVEKVAAMEELDGGGLFDDSDPETPPIPQVTEPIERPSQNTQQDGQGSRDVGMSLGGLPSPKPEEQLGFPSPWQAGPKLMQRSEASNSAPQGVSASRKRRSHSGGADTLKKFIPKSLPSLAQARNYFSSAAFGSSPKSPNPLNSPKDSPYSRQHTPRASLLHTNSLAVAQPRALDSTATLRPQRTPSQSSNVPQRPHLLRRSTSDDSLLYHSLSRASSLGDDARFENHTNQVNSRAKAIRDSLQDRSSFRMPQLPALPSMPSMPRVPNFNFSMNFLNTSDVSGRMRSNTDPHAGILPGSTTKKPTAVPNPAVTPGMVGAAVSRPEAAVSNVGPVAHGADKDLLERAMETLTGDIVIMGGYRGSVLRSAKPPHRQLWVPVKVGLNIRKVDLEVGLEPEDEERMEETIFPSGMLQNIGPVDISKRLFKRLRECENSKNGKLRVWDYGYDWRLSPHLLARKLTAFLEKLPSNQPGASEKGALVLAHSLGGVITRHVCNQRPELFSGIIYAGTPQSCINILGPFRNGDAVLLSSRVLTAQVNFTLRTSFVLLPEDGSCFVDIRTKEEYPVDFFNIDTWIKYRLSPCTDPPLPPYKNPSSGGLGSLLNLNLSGSLLNLPGLPVPGKKSGSPTRRSSISSPQGRDNREPQSPSMTTRAADVVRGADGGKDRTLAPQMGNNINPVSKGQTINSSISTAVTIPREKAIAYLKRTLAETKKFKQELYFNPSHSDANRYPPLAIIYGKGIPTCCGAKVYGLDSIPCSDVYDNLAFASGDGVCLARQAMLPEGYLCVKGGRVRSDRGHVTLLGDLNAVGRAILAVRKGREKGIGLGVNKGKKEGRVD